MFSINLVFVDAKIIRNLNKKYRHLDKVATVLSFYYGETGQARLPAGQAKFPKIKNKSECFGEIVICLSEAKKQNLITEKLVVHGLKNLLSQIPLSKLQ